jgi:hypothetical protein
MYRSQLSMVIGAERVPIDKCDIMFLGYWRIYEPTYHDLRARHYHLATFSLVAVLALDSAFSFVTYTHRSLSSDWPTKSVNEQNCRTMFVQKALGKLAFFIPTQKEFSDLSDRHVWESVFARNHDGEESESVEAHVQRFQKCFEGIPRMSVS